MSNKSQQQQKPSSGTQGRDAAGRENGGGSTPGQQAGQQASKKNAPLPAEREEEQMKKDKAREEGEGGLSTPAPERKGNAPAAKERVGRDDEDVDQGSDSRGKDQPRKDNAGANRSR